MNIKAIHLSTYIVSIFIVIIFSFSVLATAQVENPQSGGIGLQGQISAPPPTSAPTISSPGNGATITQLPIEVRGICTNGLLVKLFKNNVFSGSAVCQNGSYSITIDLFSGRNDLIARHVDDLNQSGPDSNQVSITYSDGANRPEIAERITITTVYAKRGANPGETLTWPIIISGGTPPYAISVDWGDGSLADVYSVERPGEVILKHVYETAGIYRALVKITDKNGRVGYMQLSAISNGEINQQQVAGAVKEGPTKTRILWEPIVLTVPFIITTFYLGKKYMVTRIKKKLERGEHPFS
jgi:hypothetical protein